MKEKFTDIINTFNQNQESVKQLMNFDQFILDLCILHLEALDKKLRSNNEIKITNKVFLPSNTIRALKGIRKNNSMSIHYESIYNQSLVLSISYFTSTLQIIFRESINYACCCCPELLSAKNDDIKITFNELKKYQFDLSDNLGDLIIKKKGISFQDMKSTVRTFKDFLNVNCERDMHMNNIIFAQASRHSIVHSLGKIDDAFLSQIKNATPRDIKATHRIEDPLKFTIDEINVILTSMQTFISRLVDKICDKIES